MVKVIVDRKTWLRGNGAHSGVLLNENGERCCIGFLAKTIGIPDNDMYDVPRLDQGSFGHEIFERNGLNIPLHYHCVYENLYSYNDNDEISDSVREEKLIQEGNLIGIEFEFIG